MDITGAEAITIDNKSNLIFVKASYRCQFYKVKLLKYIVSLNNVKPVLYNNP